MKREASESIEREEPPKHLIIDPDPLVQQCSTPHEYSTMIDWTDESPSVFIRFFIPNSPPVLHCYNGGALRRWINNKDHTLAKWVQKPGHGPMNEIGLGGMPDLHFRYVKLYTGEFLENNTYLDDLKRGEEDVLYDAIYKGPQRLGNLQGEFGVSALHGQLPPESTYELTNPQMVKPTMTEKHLESQIEALLEHIHANKGNVDKFVGIELSLLAHSLDGNTKDVETLFSRLFGQHFWIGFSGNLLFRVITRVTRETLIPLITDILFPVIWTIKIPSFLSDMCREVIVTYFAGQPDADRLARMFSGITIGDRIGYPGTLFNLSISLTTPGVNYVSFIGCKTIVDHETSETHTATLTTSSSIFMLIFTHLIVVLINASYQKRLEGDLAEYLWSSVPEADLFTLLFSKDKLGGMILDAGFGTYSSKSDDLELMASYLTH
jgi:hypothetical protein